MTDLRTKSQAVSDDIAALLRARNPLLWIVTREEARVERYLFQAAAATKYVPLTWDCAAGVANADGARQTFGGRDPGDAFAAIEQQVDPEQAKDVTPTRRAWIMRDLPAWLAGPAGMATTRQLRNLIRALPSVPPPNAQAIIVLSTSADVPESLRIDPTPPRFIVVKINSGIAGDEDRWRVTCGDISVDEFIDAPNAAAVKTAFKLRWPTATFSDEGPAP